MFPFWQDVVAPLIAAVGARRVVEIGALRGENTELMLGQLGPDVELHVIDPVPSFDPSEHERRFPGRYVFHEALSLDVLGDLPPMDVALIDGDHNWYTVRNELRLLAEVAEAAGAPVPLMVLHDVGWPYGRRDLYYDPDTIPEEHRQPYARRGMRPDDRGLAPGGGGMNPSLCNALEEGGPRNGVLTGVDDFLAEHEGSFRLVVLPVYFGLAIVAPAERLAASPALAAELDRLESHEGATALLRLGERIRIDGDMLHQAMIRNRDEWLGHVADLYLDTVKAALVGDHHVEGEARLRHVLERVDNDAAPRPDVLRDPARHAPALVQQVQREHGTARGVLDHLHECLGGLWATGARGDLAACGFGFGASPVFLAAYLHAADLVPPGQRRKLWVVDAFRPSDGFADLNQARDVLHRFGLLDDRVRFLQGDPAATLDDLAGTELALLHLGPAPAEHLRLALERLHPRLVEGGIVVVEDASAPGVEDAVAAFRAAAGVTAPLERVGRSLHWVKAGEPAPPPAGPPAPPGASRAPLTRPTGFIAPDLSVVVVVHDMRREAERSLHSLSRRYQEAVDDVRYEVVVVENGSDPDQRLGEDLVRGIGREFRYVDMGSDATPSPAPAMNRGIDESRGYALALMVDGAHVLTPRVLHYGMAGLAAYAPAVVATQPWYVGPGQQGEAMRSGYDTAVEDELFGRICWPDDGYRLFEIGHFVGDRDWFDGLWESNCLFASRRLLEQVGGFDEGFAMAGGGYTNLDLYERLTSSPDVRVVSILGEGSFHQVHGGTTTNLTDPLERRQRVRSYTDHFAELRGRPFMGPEKTIHYVGGFSTDAARRTRSRRMTAKAFEVDRELEGLDGPAEAPPLPMPDDLRDAFTTAYYRSLAWRETTWLGVPVPNAATDLLAYQELVSEVRPDWIVETGTQDGGRAHFLATVCDLVGHGRVLSVGPAWKRARRNEPLPEHPRITYIDGPPHDPAIIEAVHGAVGPEPHALVILGTRGPRMRTTQEFEAYAPLVRPGSYVVVEHTVVNGFPVDASFGPGPHESLRRILNVHGEFLSDTSREKHGLTFNASGFLRRLS